MYDTRLSLSLLPCGDRFVCEFFLRRIRHRFPCRVAQRQTHKHRMHGGKESSNHTVKTVC